MIAAGARLAVLDLSDNAFGPIGVEGLAKLLQSDVCSDLEVICLIALDNESTVIWYRTVWEVTNAMGRPN